MKVIFTSAMTFAVTLIYFVILDLDSAYTGSWAVTNDRYKELLDENRRYIVSHNEARAQAEASS